MTRLPRSKSVVAFLHLPDLCDDLLHLIFGKSLFQECVRRIPVHLSIGACDDEFTDFLFASFDTRLGAFIEGLPSPFFPWH
jgi:hypothetical protein